MRHDYDIPDIAWGKCVDACEAMLLVFPELRRVNGVVFAKGNPDNPCTRYPKEYPHAWLVDKEGNIVDPTASQFSLIGDIYYREIDVARKVSKCIGCGTFFHVDTSPMESFCGKCEWSDF